MNIRRILFALLATAATVLAAQAVSAGEAVDSVVPEPPMEPSAGVVQFKFDRPCNASPASKLALKKHNAKREPARQDRDRPFSRPGYPEAARLRQQEGEVVMLLLVNEEGSVAIARVDRSSGFPMLDEAALTAAGDWHVVPAKLDGTPVCSWSRFSMNFRLSEFSSPDLASVQIRPGAYHLLELLAGIDLPAQITLLSGGSEEVGATTTLTDLVLQAAASRSALDRAMHDSLAMISLQLSDEEIAQVTRFVEDPAGRKLIKLVPDLISEFTTGVTPKLLALGCQASLLRSALKSRNIGDADEIQEDFRSALPRLLDDSDSYCNCAARQYFRTARMTSIVDGKLPDVTPACGAAPDFKW